ncbi:Zinc finger (C3HC4-type RING finger) family protein [Rhynchospora pubera]|uniref:RING-type E3 ubiquitin transferase n=1 Tax=Rhynchospora pubera TaxID=906938 RepID=A0AAV8F7I6_9POAL|nr:Zinc finger (C3HC4-type RING finger) family protein [Rhynchospora pubera]
MAPDLPCDGDGDCMVCKAKKPTEVVLCRTCVTPWHVPCLSSPPQTLADEANWLCPDCAAPPEQVEAAQAPSAGSSELIAAIRAIEADTTLSEMEKARKRQRLMAGGGDEGEGSGSGGNDDVEEEDEAKEEKKNDVLEILDQQFNCSFCMQLPDRPVTTPCGHNFCLKCFQKWVGQGKRSCGKCRSAIPPSMVQLPRINSSLVTAIRMAKAAKSINSGGPAHTFHFIRNDDRPEKAFTTERAKKNGKANACSGQIFVTVPPDHFGPILPENDPKRNQGVLVGESWEDRMECRQWGAHLPHVAGIAGQSNYGAQSVALSGGYVDDEDHGEWFLYTGSGGRDLSGNKRTNKDQAFDQKFEKMNEALRVSCLKGYPVRVVRSHKEKRSSYAPEKGVRYDGVYRIERCWRKVGKQGFKVCRYLFVRCDNEPAPWTSDDHGDRPRQLPDVKELKSATDITIRNESPAWDYDEKEGWTWKKPPPVSRKPVVTGNPDDKKRARKAARLAQNLSVRERLLKEFGCPICKKVFTQPLTTPCGHNFCKDCLIGAYADKSFVQERMREGGRTLRARKIIKKCPACPTDIAEFLQNPQVNREMNNLIETLKKKSEEEAASVQQNEADEADEADEAGDIDDMVDADKDGVDDGADDVDNNGADADEAKGVDDVADTDEDGEAEATVKDLDESEPSDGAVENGNVVTAEDVECKKVVNSTKRNTRLGGRAANGKAASTKEIQAEKLNASGKRKGMDDAGGRRGSKKVKRDV